MRPSMCRAWTWWSKRSRVAVVRILPSAKTAPVAHVFAGREHDAPVSVARADERQDELGFAPVRVRPSASGP